MKEEEEKIISLKTWMIASSNEIIKDRQIQPHHVNLKKFETLKDEIPTCGVIDDINAPALAAKCNELVDLCNVYSQVTQSFYLAARKRRKSEQALALLERSTTYFTEKEIKSTDKAKSAYVDIDEESIKWVEIEDMWNVLSKYFSTLHDDFRDRHIWYRRIIEMKMSQMTKS